MPHLVEHWRDIPSWPDYAASDLGRVRRNAGYSKYRGSDEHTAFIRERIMTITYDSRGRGFVTLNARGKRKRAAVHRLVMEAFHGPSDLLVRHLDDDPSNNRLYNLAYGTQQDNMNDRTYHRAVNAQFSEDEADEIRRLHSEEGLSMRKIGREYGVNHSVIRGIVRGLTYK